MKSSSALVAGAFLLSAVSAFPQSSTTQSSSTATQSSTTPSLAELAKKTQEKQAKDKKGPTPPKTFTNADLQNSSPPPSDADASTADAKSGDEKDAKSGDAAKAGDTRKEDPSKTDPAKTEKYWHDRMDAAREDVRRNQAFAAALQSRINGLTADFAARDDPYQRAQIADDRQKALAELDRVNKAVEDGNKAIASIEEEARKAMVPPGWIR